MSVKARSGKTTPTTNLPPWRQIRWALVFLFVALTAVPLIAVQAINIIEGSQNARQMVFSQLESVAELKIDQIDRWIAANDIALDIIGAALNDPLVALAESPDEDASQALQQRMAELIVPDEEGETPLLTELFFYTTDGVIRAASSESQVGKIVTQQPYYAPSLSEETLTDPYIQPPFYDVATGDLTMIFTYPITNEAGELVGVLAAKPEVGFLGEVMTQRTGLGETGETYLVSLESHYLLTPSHFEGYPLRRAYHSEGIDRALEGESGSGLYEGYRGTRVFGVYRWLPELQAALIAEEEQAEAFAPFREVTATTASLTGLAVLVAAALGSIAAIELSRPINALTEAAVRIAGGDFSKRAKVRARNEIGVLADTFNMMAERIQDLVTTLEERVAARTRDLEVAVEVSRQVSTILDLDRLLTEFVELTKESFNLYHVHVYLLDETGRTLAVQAGSGEAGRILKQRGHHIPLNTEHSLVARAARLLEPVVINDVTQEPDFLPNPLLPKTRSEMAIPLAVGDQLVGVLDVQADEPNHFEKEDVQALMVLAGQVAVAVQNASTFTERERVQAERERIRRRQELAYELGRQLTTLLDPEALLRETVNRLSEAFEYYHAHVYLLDEEEQKLVVVEGLGEAGRIMKEGRHSIALDVERSLVARAARSRQPIVVNDVTGDPDHLPNPLLPETRAEVAVPLIFGERVLGVLDVQSRLTGHFDEDEVRTLQIIANQLAVALSNARLFRETESALLQVEGLYQAGQALIAAQDMEEMLRAFAMPLWSKGKCDATLFQVGPDGSKSPEWVEVVAYASETGTPPAPVGQRFPVPNLSPFSKLAENPDHILLIPDVMESEHLDEEMARRFLRINIRSLVLVPLVVADEWEGVVAFSWPEPHTLSEEDVQLYNALTPQMATLVHNQHLFREVEQSERLLRSIIDSTQDWIFVKDRDFRYVLVNRAFAEFYGQRSPEEMIGKDDYDLGTPAYLIEGDPERGIRGFRTDDRAVIEEGKTIHNPFDVVLWPDGSEHILDTQKTPLYDAEGNIIGVLGVARDVTERERIRRRQELAHDLAQQLTTLLDPDELLRETVNRLSEAFEYYHAHIYLLDEEEQKLVVAEGLGEAGRIMKESGHSIPVELERSLVARAARSRQPVVVNDVTKDPDHLPNPLLPETRAEVAIPLVLGDQLLGVLDVQSSQVGHFDEDEVRTLQIVANQLAVALSNARLYQEQLETAEQLRELDKLKSEFLANMSHELRTPLNSIIGYSELLIDDLGDQLDEMSLEDLQAIHASGHHLLALINDILDLAKIEAGRMELSITDIDLGEFIPPLVDMSRVLLKDKPDVELQLDIPETLPTVKADPVRLRQILWNLLSNAIKFTDEGYVKLTAQADDGWMYISVEDTGIGIPKEYHEVIFDQFRQMDGSATRREGGTGLGLTITRQLVYMHGGDLQLESEPGQGSTFTVKLPLVAAVDQRSDGRGREISGNGARATGRQESQTTETPGD